MIHTKNSLGVEGKRNVRRPRLRWRDVTRNGIIKLGIQEDDAKDRNRWTKIARAVDPAIQRDYVRMKKKKKKEKKKLGSSAL